MAKGVRGKKPKNTKEDPFNLINSAIVKKGKIRKYIVNEIPWYAFSKEPFDKKEVEEERLEEEAQPKDKIHPILKQWMRERHNNEKEQIIISFRDDLIVPRFPEPNVNESRKSAFNKNVLKESQKLIEGITERRAGNYKKIIQEITDESDKVLETFWLINSIVVESSLSKVSRFAEHEDVIYVEPRYTGEKPPSNPNPNDDVDDGRTRMVSDPYFNLNLRTGWIGLLDTGMRFTHTLFNSPSQIDFRRDCIRGGANCNTGSGLDPSDDCWNHGTCSGAIISGNANLGNPYRGVTRITLDSFKVYPNSCGGLDEAAVVSGFQTALAVLDRVIVAEMQGGGSDVSIISSTADNAFDAGAVIIAANGNNGPAGQTVNTPANAHKVVGVGAFDVQTLDQYAQQSRGPAPDNRFKPDIQAPTNTETASSASDSALRVFGGTSGATPYAAGAAALLRNWLRGSNFSIDPGQVYAQIILCGQQPYPFNNTSGAGRLRLPTDGWVWWGKVSVNNGMTINIPLNLSGSVSLNTFDGAIWWPETASQQHNDIDLYLVDPTGTPRASSYSFTSIFERARVSGSITSGTWSFRMRGYNVPTGSQNVYWAAAHFRL
jgi:serine protease AprX